MLDLGSNPDLDLADTFNKLSTLTNLQWLNLSDNKFTHLPKEIGKLKNLKYLYLENNRLTKLPREIGKLKYLEILDLDDNPLTQDEIDNIEVLLPNCNIRFLDLSNKQ
jgi:Leucine-rich repeat (LRR) protein